ncbi:tagatose-bisphosphate aldolase [Terribacillus saccharophilus]|uniref:tagatose-bisphosphate aldolase n=1 Tax=Terribacillus saccharophilus TaxID=361277 RepID=UPI002DCBA54D|nr:tagatose-bisphosphate aldolase [Terribacillus saccharophilus]
MLNLTPAKREALERLSDENGIIGALAIDQRGSLKKMLQQESTQNQGDDTIVSFKELISEELTPYATSILLDPEYGLPAAQKRDKHAGLLLAYEKTGYDATQPGRMPDILDDWSVQRIKAQGADAVKFLLYYDVDEDSSINEKKHIFVERLGSECQAEDILFFLELVSYDADNDDVKGSEYAKVKPHKVNDMMIEFSKPQYKVDVLKVEVPVNMKYVEGFSEETPVYSREEAQRYFKEQSEATDLPFIFLSAGVSASLFQETLRFAKEACSSFNGVLCGRATWKDSASIFGRDGEAAGKQWLQQQGRTNVEELNEVLKQTATSWKQAEILA